MIGRLKTAGRTLLSHWMRQPVQLATLLIGLALATGLWTGVQAINEEARASYAQASNAFGPDRFDSLVRTDGAALTIDDFVALQRAGWRTSPVLEGRFQRGEFSVRVLGIEPLTLPDFGSDMGFASTPGGEVEPGNPLDFIGSDGAGIAAPDTALALDTVPDAPPVRVADNIAPGLLIVDIAVAERLLSRSGEIDRLLIGPDQPVGRIALAETGIPLAIRKAEQQADLARLTDSFHLNLTAFGLLSFAVGLFIVHATIGLAFEQRRGVFRTLRTLGLTAGELTLALVLELLAIAVVAGAAGVLFGYLIAAALLPDVAATLRGLYGAEVGNGVTLRPSWWAIGLGIAVLGTFIAAAGSLARILRLPVLASAQPRAWVVQSARSGRVRLAAAGLLLSCGAALLAFGTGLIAAFALLGCFLVGSALLLPDVFALVLRLGESRARGALAQWFWADTRQQIPGLSLALMALLLALAANIGVSTMVGSFRTTFTGWLDQRLAAELYMRVDSTGQRDDVLGWLDGKVDAILPIDSADSDLAGVPGEIFAMVDHATFRENWPLLAGSPGVWDELAAGTAMLVNEQLARREDLSVGDTFALPVGTSLPIGGVYSDYGNPAPQVILGRDAFLARYPQTRSLRFALRLPPDRADELAAQMRDRFALREDQVVNQSAIKNLSIEVFDRTFTVTDALNVLTLAVAGFAIFTSLLTLATIRLPQLAPMWALGLTRRRLAGLELVRTVLLACLTGILALPVGLVLAWILLAKVNVEAFGWRLPMSVFPADWLWLGTLAVLAALLAASIPALRLARTAPSDLMKVFTHER